MSPKVRRIDRAVTALVGVLLIALGLLVLAWRYVPDLGITGPLDTTIVLDALASGWWAWVLAVVGVLLGLLGLRWLLAHLPTPTGRVVRTVNDDRSGRSRIDLTSVATASAARFAELAPVVSTGGGYRRIGGHHVVEVRAAVDDRTSADLVAEAVRAVDADLQAAFEEGAAHLRVLLGSPSRLPTAVTRAPGTGRSADESAARVEEHGAVQDVEDVEDVKDVKDAKDAKDAKDPVGSGADPSGPDGPDAPTDRGGPLGLFGSDDEAPSGR